MHMHLALFEQCILSDFCDSFHISIRYDVFTQILFIYTWPSVSTLEVSVRSVDLSCIFVFRVSVLFSLSRC